jgi:hypothetical protein
LETELEDEEEDEEACCPSQLNSMTALLEDGSMRIFVSR